MALASEVQEGTLKLTWQRVKEDFGNGSVKGAAAEEGLKTLGPHGEWKCEVKEILANL